MSKIIASTLAVLVLGCSVASAEGPGDKVMFVIELWRKPGSNNIGTADVVIDNGNDFAIKDIRVRCDYAVKATGKKIETTQNVAVTGCAMGTASTATKNHCPRSRAAAGDVRAAFARRADRVCIAQQPPHTSGVVCRKSRCSGCRRGTS